MIGTYLHRRGAAKALIVSWWLRCLAAMFGRCTIILKDHPPLYHIHISYDIKEFRISTS